MNMKRSGAVAGFVAFALGGAAASFERGAPPIDAPAREVVAFFADYRTELLVQSFLFILSAAAWFWFLGGLRAHLLGADKSGRLTAVAFVAGAIGIGVQALIQAPQSALALASSGNVEPSVAQVTANLGYALSVIAYIPLAVMMAAVAVVSLRTLAFPRWMAWLSAAAGTGFLVMSSGIAFDSGPLAGGGPLTYVLYGVMAAWLLATSSVMFRQGVKLPPSMSVPDTPQQLIERLR